MSRSSNTPATPVSNPASAQGVEPIGFMRPEDNDGGSFWCSRSKNGYYTEAVYLSPAPSRDAAVPASGGVDVEAFHEAFELIFEAYASPADVFQTDTAWAMSMSRKVNKAYGLLQKVRASLSPAPTSGSEAGAFDPRDDFEIWADADHRDTAALEFEERDPDNFLFYAADGTNQAYVGWYFATKAALAKPASEPAGGGWAPVNVRTGQIAADHVGATESQSGKSFYSGWPDGSEQAAKEGWFIRRVSIAALSSAPATPSPLPAGVDVHEEWQRRLKRNDFSDDDWSEWKACDERQVRDIQTLGHPSGFPFLNAEVRRVRITTTALSASAPAPEERAATAEAEDLRLIDQRATMWLSDTNWRPSRSHIESMRNAVRKVAAEAEAKEGQS